MNLVKELHQTARKNYEAEIKEAKDILQSVKDNLNIEDVADNDMIKFFGTGKEIPKQKQKIKSAKHNMKYEFVTDDDVYAVCKKYYLRFLPASLYKKYIPFHALNDLRKFKTERKLCDADLQDGLMMIAPANHFELGRRPKNDPVLLWKNNGFYNVISQWGNDFTWKRLAKSFLLRYWPAFLGLFILSIGIYAFQVYNSYEKMWEAPDWSFITAILGCVFGAVITLFGVFVSPDHDSWNEPYKR